MSINDCGNCCARLFIIPAAILGVALAPVICPIAAVVLLIKAKVHEIAVEKFKNEINQNYSQIAERHEKNELYMGVSKRTIPLDNDFTKIKASRNQHIYSINDLPFLKARLSLLENIENAEEAMTHARIAAKCILSIFGFVWACYTEPSLHPLSLPREVYHNAEQSEIGKLRERIRVLNGGAPKIKDHHHDSWRAYKDRNEP